MFGRDIDFERYLGGHDVYRDKQIVHRNYFLNERVKRKQQLKSDPHYQEYGDFFNK
jgi:hypothetical protein